MLRRTESLLLGLGILLVLGACSQMAEPRSMAVAVPRLMVSLYPDRSAAFPLPQAALDGNVYVFLDGAKATAKVRFFVDDRERRDAPFQVESSAPYDLAGGDAVRAHPFDTATLANGSHSVTAELLLRNGDTVVVAAEFEVANAAPAPDPSTPTPPTTEPPSDEPPSDEPPAAEPPTADAPQPEGNVFVAPDGHDDATGSREAPFATVQRAVDAAKPGDVIYLRAGVYQPSGPVRIDHDGTQDAPITLASFPGERAVLDGSHFVTSKPVVKLTASHWRLADLEVRNGPYYGVLLTFARHNTLERLSTHHNGMSGIHLFEEASHNLIVDSDSYGNYDPASGGENADGFAIKHATAVGNTILRCRAWNNSDDGYDLLDSPPQRVDRSVAFRNGLRADGTPYPNGNGNGFKLGIGAGRYQAGGGHLVTRSVAWENEVWGFNSNNGTVPITLYNNTAWGNGWYDFFFSKGAHVLVNNLSFGGKNYTSEEVVKKSNSWTMALEATPFVSTDATSPDFLRLKPDSAAINRGADVGMPFLGEAPDLGAIELGEAVSVQVGLGDAPEPVVAVAMAAARP